MKKAMLSVIVFLLLCSDVFAVNWAYIETSEDKAMTIYVDTDSITVFSTKDGFSAWVKMDFSNGTSTSSLVFFNAAPDTVYCVRYVMERAANGSVKTYTFPFSGDNKLCDIPVPGTMMWATHQFIVNYLTGKGSEVRYE
jgi:hypothetical protein